MCYDGSNHFIERTGFYLLYQWLVSRKTTSPDDVTNPGVRAAYGTTHGLLGLILNTVLFAVKLCMGLLTGSVSITADAFNNLSDASSCLVTLIGFRLAGKQADMEHPFGHGRIEYVAGLIVSFFILLMGWELLRTSIGKILHPTDSTLSLLVVLLMLLSILVKAYMAMYSRYAYKKLDSPVMKAAALDSLSDMFTTSAILVCSLLQHRFGWHLDGYAGLLVSILILFGGIQAARDTIHPLLGTPPDPEKIRRIEDIVLQSPSIQGMHDLIIHDYGPGRQMISLHAEVSDQMSITQAHEAVTMVENKLHDELGCDAVIHVDPVQASTRRYAKARDAVMKAASDISKDITIHDFRSVTQNGRTLLSFDMVLPYGMDEEETIQQMKKRLRRCSGHYECVIQVDRPYAQAVEK